MVKITKVVVVAMAIVFAFSCSSVQTRAEAERIEAERIEAERKKTEIARFEQERHRKIEEHERERVEWLYERKKFVSEREKEEHAKYNEGLAKYEKELAEYEKEWAKYEEELKKAQMSKYAHLSRYWVTYYYEKKFGIKSDEVDVARGDSNNPYNFERDRYYYISLDDGYVNQWLDSNSVLFYLEGGDLAYLYWNEVSLNKKFDKKRHLDCLFIYEGVYEYKIVSGSVNKVPKFKMINIDYKTKEDIEKQVTELAMQSYGKAKPEKPNKVASKKEDISQKLLSGFILVEGGSGISDFYVDESEVTLALYGMVMGKKTMSLSYPVTNVSWYDAVNFCNRLSMLCGLEECYVIDDDTVTCDFNKNGYRLPTEAEWEWAAKGGVKSKGYKYSGSNEIDDVAWYDGNSGNILHPVRLKKPNELGLYDMSGNVREWCWDLYSAFGSPRVRRGGSWSSDAGVCSVSSKDYSDPSYTSTNIGFRLARSARD